MADINEYTYHSGLTEAPVIQDEYKEFRKLGLMLPPSYPATLPKLTAVPGFKAYTRQEIEEAVKTKPWKSRDVFKGAVESGGWIENQGGRGSCCPTAATGGNRRGAKFAGVDVVPNLSAEYLYSLVNRGRDEGALLDEVRKALTDNGQIVRNDEKHPFNKHILKRDYGFDENNSALNYRCGLTYAVDNELDLATFLLKHMGGAVVAVDVNDDFTRIDSNGFCGGGRGPGNHAVCVDDVEIINGELSFDMANSWGLQFGRQGRAYTTWKKHFVNTVKYHQFFVILGNNWSSLANEIPDFVS